MLIPPRRLYPLHPLEKNPGRSPAKEIAQNVDALASGFARFRMARADLDRADQVQTRAAGSLERPIIARQRVVVADGQRFQTDGAGLIDQLGRRQAPVGLRRVAVQIDHLRPTPNT